jgi:hypothetical protein
VWDKIIFLVRVDPVAKCGCTVHSFLWQGWDSSVVWLISVFLANLFFIFKWKPPNSFLETVSVFLSLVHSHPRHKLKIVTLTSHHANMQIGHSFLNNLMIFGSSRRHHQTEMRYINNTQHTAEDITLIPNEYFINRKVFVRREEINSWLGPDVSHHKMAAQMLHQKSNRSSFLGGVRDSIRVAQAGHANAWSEPSMPGWGEPGGYIRSLIR